MHPILSSHGSLGDLSDFHFAVLTPHRAACGGACTSILFSPYFIINVENISCSYYNIQYRVKNESPYFPTS